MQKPTLPKGMRDFEPIETARRNYIFSTISNVYSLFGFHRIETPAMETLSALTGKYGEEGDRLLFKVLDSGNVPERFKAEDLSSLSPQRFAAMACEKGLRYDLTVPFARYVVMHRNDITFPFKRYQIQPVWRADRPQKGRYREFYQCDGDIIGSESLLCEAELVQIIDEVFRRLEIPVCILLNNRKILYGIAELAGQEDRLADITVAIDKLDKIGREKTEQELLEKGFSEETVARLLPVIMMQGTNEEKLMHLRTALAGSPTGMKGVEELTYVLDRIKALPMTSTVVADISLARGLSYYTGAIFEVKAGGVEMGSIAGGGRYDNLTEIFGLNDMSGVGISFGADRIYDVLQELGRFEAIDLQATRVLFVNFGMHLADKVLALITEVRRAGISAAYYPESVKLKKQLAYANANNIPYVLLPGDDEFTGGFVQLKDMQSGEQHRLSFDAIIPFFQS